MLDTRSPVPEFYEDSYDVAVTELEGVLAGLQSIGVDLETLESRVESLGGPWTPGRMPEWDDE